MTVTDEFRDLGASLAPSAEERAAVKDLLGDIATDLKTLARQEMELAKAEITSQVSKVGKGVGMFVAAAFAGLMTVIFLSTALWWGLSNVMDQSWAALIVAAVWALIAVLLAVVGRAAVKSISLKPERTLNSIKQLPGAFQGR